MSKIVQVAIREFVATVATKGFIIGMLVFPAIIGLLIVVLRTKMFNMEAPIIQGEIAVIDRTGEIATELAQELAPEKIAERRAEQKKKIDEAIPPQAKAMAQSSPQGRLALEQSTATALGQVPKFNVVTLDSGTDIEQAKAPLREKLPQGKNSQLGRFALLVLRDDAVTRKEGAAQFGTYDLFVRGKVDDRIVEEIERGAKAAIITARVRSSGLDRDLIEALTTVRNVETVTVTAEGEAKTNEIFNVLLPAGFMVLLLISILTSGTNLLTTMVEEKSNRVVEVLLSAVSPMQLMAGKIFGQMAVGFVVLALYSSLGLVALISFAMLGLLDAKLLVFLLIFYLLSYLTIASLMAAVGSAVNEMREAQNLNMPIMMFMMIPWILWMPISRDPNSTLATVLSFIPPMGNMVMLLRMTSTSPPPMWQTWLTVGIGIVGAYAAIWFAAKVFRIGLLMFGKPPSFATLIKWARMA